MAAQVYFYNAIFFTYALVLTAFYGMRRTGSAGTSCRLLPEISSGRYSSDDYSIPLGAV